MKNIQGIYSAPHPHWVGNGFPVRSLFSYSDHGKALSPFLLLDHAQPTDFSPADKPRGVGVHPHRGFETVTIVYQGEVEHRDSTGAGGVIGPGDVQWMTAGSGILHEEFHSQAFTKTGGRIEMVQLWVNLPAKDKQAPPGYQTIVAKDIPHVPLAGDAGHLRVIAGAYQNHQGPAHTFTAMDVWDIHLKGGHSVQLASPPSRTLALVVLHGTVLINDAEVVREGQLVQLAREDADVVLESNNDAVVLWLSGEPIEEPVVGYGPFVMNTDAEIRQAFVDFQNGKFGQMHSIAE
ncbi:pirin family protein [Lampropedia puyangensis]|uniref:Pirin family protein n=1 Tax=Lampropedia puyangensis TaxID=1330072 RepID=A0A4S8ESK4_9BURK|nr:pirin family protein [Lampropedia puyangensis]